MILDYKTNRPPPERPEDVAPAYIAQLAAYRAALGKLFPGRAIRAALLWTDGPQAHGDPGNSCSMLPNVGSCRASLDAIEGRT